MKQCKKCLEWKPLNNFYTRSDSNSPKSYCKVCDAEKAKQRYIDKKDLITKVQKQWYQTKRNKAHNNWEQYFKNRVGSGRKKYQLTVQDCLDILERQQGLCALSGVPLTCIVGDYREHPPTNASLDRITVGKYGGVYTKDNVRLVCSIVNSMRLHQSDADLRWWCKQIMETDNAFHEKRPA